MFLQGLKIFTRIFEITPAGRTVLLPVSTQVNAPSVDKINLRAFNQGVFSYKRFPSYNVAYPIDAAKVQSTICVSIQRFDEYHGLSCFP